MELKFQVQTKIQKPVEEVFRAVQDPDKLKTKRIFHKRRCERSTDRRNDRRMGVRGHAGRKGRPVSRQGEKGCAE